MADNIDPMDEFERLKAELEMDSSPDPSSSPMEEVGNPPDEEEISWDDVQGDLEKQKSLINSEYDQKYASQEPEPQPAKAQKKVEFQTPDFQQLQQGSGGRHVENLDFILDIPLEVTVQLGRTRMLINDLLKLGQGSVIELNKLIGEPFDVYVNGKLVARGEVVVSNDKYGIRLTDIVSPLERIQQLG